MEIDWEKIFEQFNFIKNQNSKLIYDCMVENLNSNTGWFLNRIGGSDYDAVYEYIKNNKNTKSYNLLYHINLTKELNGYFDKSTDNEEIEKNFINYMEKMYSCYINSDAFMNAVAYIQNKFNDFDNNNYNKLICRDKQIIHYYYIEGMEDFLRDFKTLGNNKKILIISPFAESIKYQTQKDRINNLINNYTFPNCEFLTYNTPITYNADYNDIKNEVTTNNWLEQCIKMENEIQEIDFDIAFLSCASYATCLGSFISKKMNKKAIYFGGVLNVLFNIYGKRYDDKYYNDINNLSYRIIAFEKDKYINTKGGRSLHSEAFNAYF